MVTNWIEPNPSMATAMRGQPALAGDDVFVLLMTNYFIADVQRPEQEVRAWLEARLELFKTYTVSSVTQSLRQPDAWLLFVSDWVVPYLGELTALVDKLGRVEITVLEAGESRAARISRWLRENAPAVESKKLLMSARVDNDDAISRDLFSLATKWVMSTFEPDERPLVLSFPYGLQYVVEDQVTYVHQQTNNHFVLTVGAVGSSYFGPFDNHSNLFKRERLARANVSVLTTRRPMWIEVVHGDNWLNRRRPAERIIMGANEWRYRFGVSGHGVDE